uniref:Auxin-responsive protein n=1 Tax=Anthurium amnicola TaxID=1678845 RepID=A0A1D1XN05_9ARAE
MAAHQLLKTPPKEEEGGGGRGAQVERERVVITTSGLQEKHLELRLGISLNGLGGTDGGSSSGGGHSGTKGGGGKIFPGPAIGSLCRGGAAGGLPQQQARVCSGLGAKRWFSEAVGGFVDPWSLAARQETAALEQRTLAYRGGVNPAAAHTLPSAPTPSVVVGWPPVRAFRKNLVNPLHPNAEVDHEMKDSKKTRSSDGDTPTMVDTKPTMFVKVNMEGYNVGRKIDLMAHSSYESLSSALQKMFRNFLPVNYSNITMQKVQDKAISSNHVLLYEDNEGDQMLVGDVPWEMFISSVKRLYITNGSTNPKRVEDKVGRNNQDKQFEHEVKTNE